jgi:hypothetical protein
MPSPNEILTPDGIITLDQLSQMTVDEMWEEWPTLAFWLWDNEQMVASSPVKKYMSIYEWDD